MIGHWCILKRVMIIGILLHVAICSIIKVALCYVTIYLNSCLLA
jgi:hypothetical protein